MMNRSLEKLLKLSVPERIQLAKELWDSTVSDPDALPLAGAPRTEIERRLSEPSVSWNQARARLRQRFGWRKDWSSAPG
jgi:putative addiction module component (TIGR02574 family)